MIQIIQDRSHKKKPDKLPYAYKWTPVSGDFFLTCASYEFNYDTQQNEVMTICTTEDEKLGWTMKYEGANPIISMVKGNYSDVAKLVSASYEYLDLETTQSAIPSLAKKSKKKNASGHLRR